MSSFTTFSSADEFSPLQPIFPNLSPSEEMSVLIARIAELNRTNTIEPSVVSSEVFRPDGNGMNDDEFSKGQEEQPAEGRKTPTKDVSEGHLKAILERIGEIEKQQQQQSKAAEKRFLQSQNDQKKILERIIRELEKQTQKKVLLKFQENCWDAFSCNKNYIEISGNKSQTARRKNIDGYCSVFAKYSIWLNKPLSEFFYYEISVMKKGKGTFGSLLSFGFAVKQQTKFEVLNNRDTYVYNSDGAIFINGRATRGCQYPYGVGDTVGIGVNLNTWQLFFTRNGKHLDLSDCFVAPSFADDCFHPHVSLCAANDQIEANFGPNFKFDLATL